MSGANLLNACRMRAADSGQPCRPQQPHLQGQLGWRCSAVRSSSWGVDGASWLCCCFMSCRCEHTGLTRAKPSMGARSWTCSFKHLNAEDMLVYQCIQAAGNMGEWEGRGGGVAACKP